METRGPVDRRIHLAELVGLKFATERFGASVARRLELLSAEDSGPGAFGRQSLVLVPIEPDGAGGVVPLGWLDSFQRVAELRSYSTIAARFLERYGTPLDLSRDEYRDLQDTLKAFLQALEIRTRTVRAASHRHAPRAIRPKNPSKRSEKLWVAVGGFTAGFSICYLLAEMGFF